MGGPVLAMRASKLYSPVRNQFGTGTGQVGKQHGIWLKLKGDTHRPPLNTLRCEGVRIDGEVDASGHS